MESKLVSDLIADRANRKHYLEGATLIAQE